MLSPPGFPIDPGGIVIGPTKEFQHQIPDHLDDAVCPLFHLIFHGDFVV
jgi:hypothetical protein